METAPALGSGRCRSIPQKYDKVVAQRKLSNVVAVFEYCLTTIWAFTCWSVSLFTQSTCLGVPLNIELTHIAATHTAGILLCTLCLLQFIVSLMIENRYEHNLTSSLFWIIWFPVIFWMLSLATTLVSFTRVMLMPKKQRARWVSPDRGILRG